MPELSPTTQAVLDAFRTSHTGQGCLAAALRAVADQVVPKCDMPRFADDATHADWVARDDVHDDLFRIATELDANL